MIKTPEERKAALLRLTETAMLASIVIVMAFTPLGYLRLTVLEITFIMIPVVTGAILVGPICGLILGTLWGVTSFIQCFGMSAFGSTLLSINPFLTFLVCVPTRMLAGWLSGMVYRFLAGDTKARNMIASFVASLSVALFNTLLFMSVLMLGFGDTEYIAGFRGDMALIPFILAFVGVQGLVEAVVTCIVGGTVSSALVRIQNKK